MNIAIIGGGLTGLTSAYELLKSGHRVTVFEKEKTLGGLAGGFKPASRRGADASSPRVEAGRGGRPQWKWNLEYFYHHFFTNDTTIISLAKELGLQNDIIIKRPVTATLFQNTQKTQNVRESENSESQIIRVSEYPTIRHSDSPSFLSFPKVPSFPAIYQLDSPLNLLTFPLLSPIDKLRTATLLAFCKLNPFWQPLEKITAEQLFKTVGGTRAWNILWKPLMLGKFGEYAKGVPASWLWARIKKRTPSLGYFRGGFQTLVDALVGAIVKQGGMIYTNTQVQSIASVIPETRTAIRDLSAQPTGFRISPPAGGSSGMTNKKLTNTTFDKILLTVPSTTAVKLLSPLSNNRTMQQYNNALLMIPHLFAQTLILETEKPILDNTYWLNVVDSTFPFIAIVAHTNYMDKKHYGGRHITYIGNYLPDGHPYLKMTKQQLLKKFLPYIQKINPSFRLPCLAGRRALSAFCFLFSVPSAQPVHTLNYSKKTPEMKTPIEGICLANLDSIYPWDRGTNYALELGKKAATCIHKS